MNRALRLEEERVIGLINRCTRARQLARVQSHVVASGLGQNPFIAAKLVRAFAESNHLTHARAVFDSISEPNVFIWTALIRGYSCKESVILYRRMQQGGSKTKPITFTLSSVIKGCVNFSGLSEGVQVHAQVFKFGFGLDERVQTALVDLYGKCGDLSGSRRVFDWMVGFGCRDVQLWNTMIAGYVAAGNVENVRLLFDSMPDRNAFTYVELITGYANCDRMDCARKIFEKEFDARSNAVVCTAMIGGYAKCGDLAAARQVFDGMVHRDVAAWNAMISAYSHAGLANEALGLFRLMLTTNVEPNQATIATIVSVCSQFGSPSMAAWIRNYIDHRCHDLLNSYTVAALIDLHAKCGDLGSAHDLFRRWRDKDLVCYSSMIAGFGVHGHGKEAIKVFDHLREAGLKPDAVCFVSMLTACSHAGMVDEGQQYFDSMRDEYGITPTAEHYMCLVDLLGKAGRVNEAYRLISEEIDEMGAWHAGIWGALLSACRIHSNVEVGEIAARRLMELEPENAGNYVLMSNIYAKARRWDDVARVRAAMRSRGMRKPPGCSWVEGEGGGATKFLTGDAYDCRLETVLEVLSWELRDQGYVPSIGEPE